MAEPKKGYKYYNQRRYKLNKERVLAINREWRKKNQSFVNFMARLRIYGLTLDRYHALCESQDFSCAICGEVKPLEIDHKHTTKDKSGKRYNRRGLLCVTCNNGLGCFCENPELLIKATAYIEKWA